MSPSVRYVTALQRFNPTCFRDAEDMAPDTRMCRQRLPRALVRTVPVLWARNEPSIRMLPRLIADDLALDDRADAMRGVLERVAVEQGDVAVLTDLEAADALVDV